VSTFHVFRKVYTVLALKTSISYHLVSNVWIKKGSIKETCAHSFYSTDGVFNIKKPFINLVMVFTFIQRAKIQVCILNSYRLDGLRTES